MSKLKILASLDKMVKSDPKIETVLTMRPLNAKDDETVAISRESNGMMKAFLLESLDSKKVITSSPFTNSYAILEQWLEAMNLKMSTYAPQ